MTDAPTPPAEIIEAAIKVTAWFSEHRIVGWTVAGCADRFPWRRPDHIVHCSIYGSGEPDYIGPTR
jgi:hypothetical protein